MICAADDPADTRATDAPPWTPIPLLDVGEPDRGRERDRALVNYRRERADADAALYGYSADVDF